MSLRILVVAATKAELDTLSAMSSFRTMSGDNYSGNHQITTLVTGVGSVSTAWAMTKVISSGNTPDLAINIGIAGSYDPDLRVGDVTIPVSDCFADAGIETRDGFQTLEEAGIEDSERFPFRKGVIYAENIFVSAGIKLIKPVRAITVNTASGTTETIEKLKKKYNPDIETMEGATFFYICSRGNIPFLALRAISNKVELRNKDNWNIPLALRNLSEKLNDLLLLF